MKKKNFFNVETILSVICSFLIGIYFVYSFIESPEQITVFNISVASFAWLFYSGFIAMIASLIRED